MAGLGLAGGLAVGLATVALAATPPKNDSFSGSGQTYWNQGSSWTGHGTASFTFKTSDPGFSEYVNRFNGTYTSRCNPGTLTVRATYLLIHKNGTFSYRFRRHFPGTTAYVRIWGAFDGNGHRAEVNYLADFVPKGQHVSNPYATSHPAKLGCASWVKGTAKG